MNKKDSFEIITPQCFDKVKSEFIVSAWIPKSWFNFQVGKINSLSFNVIDINGLTLMGSSVAFYTKINFFSKFRKKLFCSTKIGFNENISSYIVSAQGRVMLRFSGVDDKLQEFFLPVIIKEFEPHGVIDPEVIAKHLNLEKKIIQNRIDMTNFNNEVQNIWKKYPDMNLDSNQNITDESILEDVFEIFDNPESTVIEYPEIKRNYELSVLKSKYHDALAAQGPFAGGVVGRMDGYRFVVYSDDHGNHFHVQHKGNGIDARFSFPEIQLINYKSTGNYIKSRDLKRIQDYFGNPERKLQLGREFSKRIG